MKRISLPIDKQVISILKRGDEVLLTGYLYTARDKAHKRIVNTSKRGGRLPFNLSGESIYYVGPTPTPPGKIIGACGPTTSIRMDPYMKDILDLGVVATIGKGERTKDVISLIKKYRSIYFVTFGGAGAYLSKRVKEREVIAYGDLGPEAVYRLYVEDFPVIVAIDSSGETIF